MRGTVRILLAIFIIFILSGCASTNSQYQLDLLELETRLGLGEFPKTTSILVSQKGELVYEQYFGKGRSDLLNDTRSVTKAITSIVTGKMIENGNISGVEDKISIHLNSAVIKDWINDCLTVHRMDDDSGAGYGYYFWNFQFPIGEKSMTNGWFMAGNGGNIVLILPELKSVIVVTRTNYNSPTQAIETIKLVSQYIIPQLLT